MLCLTHEAGSDICVGASVKARCRSRRNLARVLRHSGYTAIKDQEVCKQIEIEKRHPKKGRHLAVPPLHLRVLQDTYKT